MNEMKSFDRKYISTTRFSVEVKSQDCWSNKKSLCSTTARLLDATGEISHAATAAASAAASAVAVPVCFCLQQDRWHHATLHEHKLYDEPTKSEVWKFYGLELLINFYWLKPRDTVAISTVECVKCHLREKFGIQNELDIVSRAHTLSSSKKFHVFDQSSMSRDIKFKFWWRLMRLSGIITLLVAWTYTIHRYQT